MPAHLSGIFINKESGQVFRFYPDGLFLDCLVREESGQWDGSLLSAWLKREQVLNGVIQGHYTMTGTQIRFSTPGHFGDGRLVDYSGFYKNGKLVLDSLDHNTGRRHRAEEYKKIYPSKLPTTSSG
jgi:hypothetical protein